MGEAGSLLNVDYAEPSAPAELAPIGRSVPGDTSQYSSI